MRENSNKLLEDELLLSFIGLGNIRGSFTRNTLYFGFLLERNRK